MDRGRIDPRIIALVWLLGSLWGSSARSGEVATEHSFRCDLDGDGVSETVEFRMAAIHSSCATSYDDFTLSINGVGESRLGHELTGECFPVDLDTTDSFIELAVTETGPSGDDATYLFRYEGGKLLEMGTLPGRPGCNRPLVIDGSGVVIVHCRANILQTWYYACRYGIDAGGILQKIPEPLYPVDTVLTLKRDFALMEEIGGSVVAVELTRGDRITLLTSDDEQWFLAETEDHRRGWFEVQSYDLLANGLRARYVFEGLLVID